jgi:hypothetical protein
MDPQLLVFLLDMFPDKRPVEICVDVTDAVSLLLSVDRSGEGMGQWISGSVDRERDRALFSLLFVE